ncbi:sensor histidine kinase [Caballeronia grimmiae]|uniref:sensor histidine kinase n=1 Tax=Caballeronia grimmiae TaxID=1071679 RepID=UPI0038BB3921
MSEARSVVERQVFVSLADYVRAEVESIVDEFAEFARTHLKSAERLSAVELRDTAAELLSHVADDMDSHQSETARSDKSRGDSPLNSPGLVGEAKSHAQDRLAARFTLNEMVSEYRALRANVVRRWRDAGVADPATAVEQVVRFNEAIDQALTESIEWYTSRRDESRELLSGVIAHDLRTPLGAIMMSAEYLVRSEELTGPETKAARRIVNSASTMAKMVSDLLDFTQVRMGGQLSISPAPISLHELLNDAIGELRAYHPEASIELDAQGELDGVWDRDRLRQVVTNLVGNAIGHGAADSPVTVRSARSGESVLLEVHNLGAPIASEHLSDIFDPLKRFARNSSNGRGHKGIGLGLFIVKAIVQAHGGSVKVVSSREEGTTFTVKLPTTAPTEKRDGNR